jgi:RimJ/RimL family protein N-acetyltransferase
MPEAIAAVVEWAFAQPSVSRVSAACDLENHSSARALEKAGFVREGILRQFSVHPNISSAARDCFEYAITRSL